MITADHGCDPTFPGTDHTREYVPLLAVGPRVRKGVSLGHDGASPILLRRLASISVSRKDRRGEFSSRDNLMRRQKEGRSGS